MYEAVRQHAPNSPQIAGAVTAVMMTVLAGYAMSNGLGARIVQVFDPPTVLASIPDIPKEDVVATKLPDTNIELTMEKPIFIPPEFPIDSTAMTVKEGPKAEIPPAPSVGEPRKAIRISPKMRAMEKPPYPAASIRAQEEGTTGLEVCVDAKGRVTSASLKQSSGHVRLDEAALKWVRGARFTPGSVDGAPQAMCGHNVFYEWTIKNQRS